MNRMPTLIQSKAARALIFLAALLPVLAESAEEAKPSALIPKENMTLWLTADGATVENNDVVRIKDHSGRGNDALRQQEPKIVAGNPKVEKHDDSGQPVLRFNGAFVGYEVPSIKNARTVFCVVSKNSAAFKKFNERFVLGGKEKTSVDYHVGAHWTDTIIELGMFKHGKVWFNGFAIDPALSEFSSKLAVISYAAGKDTIIELIARDRSFTDRSWHGDIAEIIVYNVALTEDDHQRVENYLLKKYTIKPFAPVVVDRDSVLPGHTKPPKDPAKKD